MTAESASGEDELHLTYLETSAWNRLADRTDQNDLVAHLGRVGVRMVTSVYAVGEILCTSNQGRREVLCQTLNLALDPNAPLLDHPEYFLSYAADAWRNGDSDLVATESLGAKWLRSILENPESLDREEQEKVRAWIHEGVEADQSAVFADLENIGPRVGPPFCSQEILATSETNRLFAEKLPFVAGLRLSPDDLQLLCATSDIWKAYRAMVAFTLDAAINRLPETRPSPTGRRRQRRPGGADLQQALYFGACQDFVLRDEWLRESLVKIAEAAGLQRRVLTPAEFFTDRGPDESGAVQGS